jgi:glycogen debranching enzyme
MEEIIRLEDQFYILTTSPRVDDRTCVLKQGDTFGVFDRYGDVQPVGRGDQGLYHDGTRFLSRLNMSLCGERPLLLGSTLNENNTLLNSDMTNSDLREGGQVTVPRGAIHVFRSRFIWHGVAYDRIRLSNFSLESLKAILEFQVEADFADIFEVRGSRRAGKGKKLAGWTQGSEIVLAYEGLDGVIRRARIHCQPEPMRLTPSHIQFAVNLAPKSEAIFLLTVGCEIDGSPAPQPLSFDTALAKADAAMDAMHKQECEVETSNAQFNRWMNRSLTDLRAMVTQTPHGPYPYAGIPWFSTPFGRDGIITALQLLWVNPEIARGVLQYLAETQARELDAERDAEPGKILHEARGGEMAGLGEIPFGRYYGSVDSTPLFIILAADYFQRTADKAFLQQLWPHIRAALKWIDEYGDLDGDGFVEYNRRSTKGLIQQGWKDSHDSVFHADGTLAEGPIALCEVQGYVYLARRKAAVLARCLGDEALDEQLRRQADQLKQQFEQAFWCEELNTYALALDGQKHPCRVRTSNPGHCLFAGIVDPERARRTVETLLSEGSFSGWGIRTVDASEVRYNPMSYHNGSVWPHDNAIIAAGFWRYGFRQETLQLLNALFDISSGVDLIRLPELICGFRRRSEEGPTLYPTACSPQAWASGAVLMLLPAFLGLSIDASQNQVSFSRPCLPSFIREINLRRLRVGQASLNVVIRGRDENVDVHIEREKGSVEAIVYK